jgi:hypothetical protein
MGWSCTAAVPLLPHMQLVGRNLPLPLHICCTCSIATNIYTAWSKDLVFDTSRPPPWTTQTLKLMGSGCLKLG